MNTHANDFLNSKAQKGSKKPSSFTKTFKKFILNIILNVIVFTLLLGLMFFGIMQIAKYVFMGNISQSMVPWIYFGVYMLSLMIVGIPYFIFTKRHRS